MKNILKTLNIIRNFIEVYIPVFTFTILFSTFILQIVMRYIFKYPLTWTYETSVICFSWTVILGACYSMKHRSHVTFTLIYDSLNAKNAAITRMLGNIIIIVAFVLLIKPSYEYVRFMQFQSTSVFKIKLSWIFMPFVYFLVSIIFYTMEEIIEDIVIIKQSKNKTNIKDNKGVEL